MIKSAFLHFWSLNAIYTCFLDCNMPSDVDWRLKCSKHLHINRRYRLEGNTHGCDYGHAHFIYGSACAFGTPTWNRLTPGALEVGMSSPMTKIFQIWDTWHLGKSRFVDTSMPLRVAMWSSRSQPDPLMCMPIPTPRHLGCHRANRVFARQKIERLYIEKVSCAEYAFFYRFRLYLSWGII